MFTQFKITLPKPPEYIGQFVGRLTFMSGDADAYDISEIPLDNADVLPLANFLSECDKVDSIGSGGPGYGGVPGYENWEDYFLYDVTCEGIPAALRGWEILWYDHDGREHDVILS